MTSFLFQAEDGIRYLVRSRGLGDVYKRQGVKKKPQTRPTSSVSTASPVTHGSAQDEVCMNFLGFAYSQIDIGCSYSCLLYTSDAADERSSVDLGGRRIIKNKQKKKKKNRAMLRKLLTTAEPRQWRCNTQYHVYDEYEYANRRVKINIT